MCQNSDPISHWGPWMGPGAARPLGQPFQPQAGCKDLMFYVRNDMKMVGKHLLHRYEPFVIHPCSRVQGHVLTFAPKHSISAIQPSYTPVPTRLTTLPLSMFLQMSPSCMPGLIIAQADHPPPRRHPPQTLLMNSARSQCSQPWPWIMMLNVSSTDGHDQD